MNRVRNPLDADQDGQQYVVSVPQRLGICLFHCRGLNLASVEALGMGQSMLVKRLVYVQVRPCQVCLIMFAH